MFVPGKPFQPSVILKLYLICPIYKLKRKWRVVNAAPGVIFTTLYFICAYEWAQEGRVFVPGKLLQPRVMLHSSLLGPIVSNIENEVL